MIDELINVELKKMRGELNAVKYLMRQYRAFADMNQFKEHDDKFIQASIKKALAAPEPHIENPISDPMELFLTEVKVRGQKFGDDKALDYLYQSVDELLRCKKVDDVKEALRRANPADYAVPVALGFLTITLPLGSIDERIDFGNRLTDVLFKKRHSKEQIDEILQGLQIGRLK